MVLTLEQHRVKLAWDLTEAQCPKGKTNAEWRTQMMGFGTNVHRSGALQALAFVRRDDKKNQFYTRLSDSLRDHLVDRRFLAASYKSKDLLETLRTIGAYDYMLVSREILAVSVWLKRATQILC